MYILHGRLAVTEFAQKDVRNSGWVRSEKVCSAGLKDGEPISQRDQELLIPIVSQAFYDIEGVTELVKVSVTDAARAERKSRNA